MPCNVSNYSGNQGVDSKKDMSRVLLKDDASMSNLIKILRMQSDKISFDPKT